MTRETKSSKAGWEEAICEGAAQPGWVGGTAARVIWAVRSNATFILERLSESQLQAYKVFRVIEMIRNSFQITCKTFFTVCFLEKYIC